MKILVTGINSELGANIAEVALGQGYEVIGTLRQSLIAWQNLPRMKYLPLRLEQENDFHCLPKDLDAIVHVAAQSTGTPEALMVTNGFGTFHLAEFARKNGVGKFIYISSMAVYGKIGSEVVDGSTNIGHSSAYGLGKWAGECFINQCLTTHSCFSIRCPAIVGRRSKGNFLAILADKMIQGIDLIECHNPNFLFNNVIHVRTLSEFVIQLTRACRVGHHAFPIGSAFPLPLDQIITVISQRLNYKGTIKWNTGKLNAFSIDYRQAVELGYRPRTVEQSIMDWLNSITT